MIAATAKWAECEGITLGVIEPGPMQDGFTKRFKGGLYAFIGSHAAMSYEDAKLTLLIHKVEESQVAAVIDLLLWYGVLGVTDESHKPHYIYNKGYNRRLYEAYVKSRIDQGAPLVFNPAFWNGLDIKPA